MGHIFLTHSQMIDRVEALSDFKLRCGHDVKAWWTYGCGSKPMGSHFGVGAPPIRVYFSGDWDVHRRYGILTHGHVGFGGEV